MSSLPIVHTSEESPRRLKNQEERWVPFQTLLTGRRFVAPLETEVEAIQLYPYHASLAASAMATAFSPVTAFLTCSCPLCLSTLGQCGDSRTFLRVLAHCMGDPHPRDTAHKMAGALPRLQKGWRERLKRTLSVPVLWALVRFQLPLPEPNLYLSAHPALQQTTATRFRSFRSAFRVLCLSVGRSPACLSHVSGFPALRVLRRLRHHGTLAL